MTDNTAPERIWFAPDEGDMSEHGWAGVQSGKDRLYWEAENAHHPEDDEVEYVRSDIHAARVAALEARAEAAEDVNRTHASVVKRQASELATARAEVARLREMESMHAKLAELQKASDDEKAEMAGNGKSRVWLNGGITNPKSTEKTTVTIYGPLSDIHRKELLALACGIDRAAMQEGGE